MPHSIFALPFEILQVILSLVHLLRDKWIYPLTWRSHYVDYAHQTQQIVCGVVCLALQLSGPVYSLDYLDLHAKVTTILELAWNTKCEDSYYINIFYVKSAFMFIYFFFFGWEDWTDYSNIDCWHCVPCRMTSEVRGRRHCRPCWTVPCAS